MTSRANFIAALAVVLGVAGADVLIPSASASASFGCCMIRDSERYPWVETDASFEDCEQANFDFDDDDDIFEPWGRVWWNLDC